jgi:hypothetical protein
MEWAAKAQTSAKLSTGPATKPAAARAPRSLPVPAGSIAAIARRDGRNRSSSLRSRLATVFIGSAPKVIWRAYRRTAQPRAPYSGRFHRSPPQVPQRDPPTRTLHIAQRVADAPRADHCALRVS